MQEASAYLAWGGRERGLGRGIWNKYDALICMRLRISEKEEIKLTKELINHINKENSYSRQENLGKPK